MPMARAMARDRKIKKLLDKVRAGVPVDQKREVSQRADIEDEEICVDLKSQLVSYKK